MDLIVYDKDGSLKDLYETKTVDAVHTTNWQGPYGAPVAGNIKYSISGNGHWVHLDVPLVLGASVGASTITATANLPAELVPSDFVETALIVVTNNTAKVVGVCTIDNASGAIEMGVGPTKSAFANTGNAGFDAFSIVYSTL